jgi:hypothetical protein
MLGVLVAIWWEFGFSTILTLLLLALRRILLLMLIRRMRHLGSGVRPLLVVLMMMLLRTARANMGTATVMVMAWLTVLNWNSLHSATIH